MEAIQGSSYIVYNQVPNKMKSLVIINGNLQEDLWIFELRKIERDLYEEKASDTFVDRIYLATPIPMNNGMS